MSEEYSQWARSQRSEGLYTAGAVPPAPIADYPPAVDYDSPETTGSLTGRILAYGRPDTGSTGNTARVVMIMLIALAAVVIVTVIAIT